MTITRRFHTRFRMPAIQQITDPLIQESIIRAVQNVCSTMMRQNAAFAGRSADPTNAEFAARLHVFGSVGFVGDINGIVYLCIPDDFAKFAAECILGMTAGEVEMSGDEVLRDVIGEITNMTVGGFKNALCDVGYPCKLTLPTIVRGDNLSVANIKNATRHIHHFDVAGHRLIADIQIKAE